MRRKKILFAAIGGNGWIGGLYYVKNIIYQFMQYPPSLEHFDIYIYTTKENKPLFLNLKHQEQIRYITREEDTKHYGVFARCLNTIFNRLLKMDLDADFWSKVLLHDFDYVFPYVSNVDLLNRNLVSWIPDFQYLHLKRFFIDDELRVRTEYSDLIAKKHRKLILSSRDAYRDYVTTYPEHCDHVYIVPFVSAIDEEVALSDNEDEVLSRYDIGKPFFMVANQFWVHKNHMTLFKAIHRLVQNGNKDVLLVCTGALRDYRNQNYYDQLIDYIKQNKLEQNIIILGFIDRRDQIQLMKRAIAIVQPSLFEGWGTVVEDGKTLGKDIILSNIAVHQEQMNDQCITFEKTNDEQLAEIMAQHLQAYKDRNQDWVYEIKNAGKYGRLFYEALITK